MYYISSQEQMKQTLRHIVQKAYVDGKIKSTATVWRGPDGEVVVTMTATDIQNENFAEYTDSGLVEEYFD